VADVTAMMGTPILVTTGERHDYVPVTGAVGASRVFKIQTRPILVPHAWLPHPN